MTALAVPTETITNDGTIDVPTGVVSGDIMFSIGYVYGANPGAGYNISGGAGAWSAAPGITSFDGAGFGLPAGRRFTCEFDQKVAAVGETDYLVDFGGMTGTNDGRMTICYFNDLDVGAATTAGSTDFAAPPASSPYTALLNDQQGSAPCVDLVVSWCDATVGVVTGAPGWADSGIAFGGTHGDVHLWLRWRTGATAYTDPVFTYTGAPGFLNFGGLSIDPATQAVAVIPFQQAILV